jgi:hypothetical protein
VEGAREAPSALCFRVMRGTFLMLRDISFAEDRLQAISAVIRDGVLNLGVGRRVDLSNQPVSAGKHWAGRIFDTRALPDRLKISDGDEWLQTMLRTSNGYVRKRKRETRGRKSMHL